MTGRAVMLLMIAACGGGSASTPGDDALPPGPEDGRPGDGPTGDAPPDPCAPDTWCTEDPPAAANLRSVWAADLNNVFAVGEGGVILHRRDNAWTAMTSGTTNDLQGIFGLSATDIWAAGSAGTLLHYDGTAWSPQGSFTKDFSQIWASSTDDVYFTAGGSVVHWNGQQFSSTNLPGTVYSISGTGPNDIWATGENAKVDHYTGTWQTGIDAGAGSTYFGIVALPGHVWVGSFNAVQHFTNNAWDGDPSNGTFQTFHAISTTEIWGAGGNDVGHYDGTTWTVESPGGAGASMFGISGIGRSLWIVGSDSLILHRR